MGKMDALWQYQQADMEVDKIEATLRQSTEYKRYAKLHNYIEEQRRILQRMTNAAEDRQKQIEVTKQRFGLLLQRYGDGSKKFESIDKNDLAEVERFRDYFEQLHARLAQERREFGTLVATLEKEDSQLSDMRVRLGKARKEYDELKTKIEEKRASQKDEKDALEKRTAEIAKSVDPVLLQHYQQVKRSHAAPVANVDGNKCGGCNVELSAVILRKLKENNEVVECENCGRILRMPESA